MSATIRPIRPEDEPLLVNFHRALSEHSVYLRYARMLDLGRRVAHEQLSRLCSINNNRERALVVEHEDPETGKTEIIGIGHLTKVPGTNDIEFDMIIRDDYQGQGLGTELLEQLIQVGQDGGHDRMVANMLVQNRAMRRVLRKFGFEIVHNDDPGDPMVKAVKVLGRPRNQEKRSIPVGKTPTSR